MDMNAAAHRARNKKYHATAKGRATVARAKARFIERHGVDEVKRRARARAAARRRRVIERIGVAEYRRQHALEEKLRLRSKSQEERSRRAKERTEHEKERLGVVEFARRKAIRNKKYSDSHKDKAADNERAKARTRRLKAEVVEAYGARCACCGETEREFLTIDHVHGDGAAHRRAIRNKGGTAFYVWLRRVGYPRDRFQLLCMNCNSARGWYGVCPHERVPRLVMLCADGGPRQ